MARIAIDGNINNDGVLTCNISECRGDTNTVMHLLATTAVAILKRMAQDDTASGKAPAGQLVQTIDKYTGEWLEKCFYPSLEATKKDPTCFVDMHEFMKQVEEAMRAGNDGQSAGGDAG